MKTGLPTGGGKKSDVFDAEVENIFRHSSKKVIR